MYVGFYVRTTHVRMYVYMYVRMYVRTYVCMYICIPGASRSKARVCSRSIAGTLVVLCVVRLSSGRRADHSSRGVLLSVACLIVIVKP